MLPFLRTRSSIIWYSVLALVVLTVLFLIPEPLVEILWMRAVGYEAIFWKTLGIKAGLFVGAFALVALYLGVNSYVLLRHFPVLQWLNEGLRQRLQMGELQLTPRMLRVAAAGVTFFFAFLFGVAFAGSWEAFVRFAGDQAFGTTDPLFERDISFYLLRLPLLKTLQSGASLLLLLGLGFVTAAYVFVGNVTVERGRLRAPRGVALHLAVNAALMLLAWAWGFYLDRFDVLFSPTGIVFGAGYVDARYVLPALWVMAAACVLLAALVLYSALSNRLRFVLVGFVAFVVLYVGGLFILPGIVQQFRVEPNELEAESPYLRHNIMLTRLAYGLDEVTVRSYEAGADLSMADFSDNASTLENIRLWDPRLLIQTYRQLQEIRLYYQFYEVDVDRYRIDGEYREVMLSARELEQRLPAQSDTWVNRHLQFTHGYGLAMNLVTQEGEEGVPDFLIRDLPPVAAEGLDVTQPAIYYGEFTPTYRIVDTGVEELDYPQGDDNVYTNYGGTGGVLVGSFWRQLLFAWYHGDSNILLSDYITDESRIQFWNRLQLRIRKIAPFVRLDADPYLVLDQGRLFWIQDGYTTATTFPYADPWQRGVNYIRNSVKIVVDAYDGTVDFYATGAEDPVLGAYREAFPGVFRDLEEMPEGLRAHLRYPSDLFEVQVDKYNRYHMTVPQVFYNNEDLWSIPSELYGGQGVPMEPYYILMRLPGEDDLQFMLMTPLTPDDRDNMIAWMAARSDVPNYGELVVYQLPKEGLIYGPNQIEARIDQDTEISQQLSLWDQRGSRVIRGNLIVVPIEEAFLYVEPVFLIAEGTQIPQLQRVIVADQDRVVMEPTLEMALRSLLGARIARAEADAAAAPGRVAAAPAQAGAPGGRGGAAVRADLNRARQALDRAMEALRGGDFATFGDELNALERILDEAEANAPADSAGGGPEASRETPVGRDVPSSRSSE